MTSSQSAGGARREKYYGHTNINEKDIGANLQNSSRLCCNACPTISPYSKEILLKASGSLFGRYTKIMTTKWPRSHNSDGFHYRTSRQIKVQFANLWIFLFQGCLVSNVLALELFKYLMENLMPCRSQLFAGLDQIFVKSSTYAMVSYRRKLHYMVKAVQAGSVPQLLQEL
ncbi:hypothetical protein GG344DRAFT_66025 [Lentinula edodes]|nr:hypothetical protein GG344DRAFT_66025 [Lentinula edodes]